MYRAVIDTEFLTTPHKAVYDFGYCFLNDRTGEVESRARFIIGETVLTYGLKSAYYANKVPDYIRAIESGAARVVSRETARNIFIDTCRTLNVSQVWAYYALADINALNDTYEYEFLPADMS